MLVSIIIPTFNRVNQLKLTLESILNSVRNYESSAEIIVVDNGSTDNTAELVRGLQSQNQSVNLKYFYDSISGLLTGRHKGAYESNGEILTFIDDDVCVSSTWIATIVQVMKEKEDLTFLTGPNLPFYETYPPDWLKYFWISTPYGGRMCDWLSLLDLGNRELEIHPNFVWGLNFTVRKSDFLELGGFHPDNISPHLQMFQGDGETGLTVKGASKKKKALYHPSVLLYHQTASSRLTYEYFDKRAFYQGVCNSYTDIRIKHELHPSMEESDIIPRWSVKYLKEKMRIFNRKNISKLETELTHRFMVQRTQGYLYHQNMFNTSKKVYDWVLRADYFDYKLPDHD